MKFQKIPKGAYCATGTQASARKKIKERPKHNRIPKGWTHRTYKLGKRLLHCWVPKRSKKK